jgi:DNA-binding XRE family transcriptional regulator
MSKECGAATFISIFLFTPSNRESVQVAEDIHDAEVSRADIGRTGHTMLLSISKLIVDYIPWIVNLSSSILQRMEQMLENTKRVLADNVKRKRQEIGLSQEALALSAEVDRTYVSQIERGVGNPSLLILCKLCVVLSVEPAELLVVKTT